MLFQASTELIEAVKEALARFRSTITTQRVQAAPERRWRRRRGEVVMAKASSTVRRAHFTAGSGHINAIAGDWLERALTEFVQSDAARSGADELMTRKVEEMWHEGGARLCRRLARAGAAVGGGAARGERPPPRAYSRHATRRQRADSGDARRQTTFDRRRVCAHARALALLRERNKSALTSSYALMAELLCIL